MPAWAPVMTPMTSTRSASPLASPRVGGCPGAGSRSRPCRRRPAHLAGIGVGGVVAQVAALDHASEFSSLTLAGTRPVAPGRVDDDLPDHDAATMQRLFALSMPDWSDRAAVAEFAAARAVILG